LAVLAHNFAIGALSRQLGQYYVVSSMKKTEIEEQKQNLLPDFEKVIPNPIITPTPIPARQPPKYQIQTEPDIDGYEDDSQRIVDDVQKGLEE
jgi:hypothetical protein